MGIDNLKQLKSFPLNTPKTDELEGENGGSTRQNPDLPALGRTEDAVDTTKLPKYRLQEDPWATRKIDN